jgi:hypothetical protein
MDKIHYVYKIVHLDTNEYYIGSRTCNLDPSLDSYMGSMRTWKPDKTKLKKIILKYDFNSRIECNEYERNLILQSYKDILNKNAHIPGVNFCTLDTVVVKDSDTGKCFRVYRNDPILNLDNISMYWKDKTHTEQTKKKMSTSALTRKTTIEGEFKRREGISKNNKKPKSETHRRNISDSKKGIKNPMYGKPSPIKGKIYEKVKCIHCQKEISVTKANLFHFDKCKNKN